MKNTKIPLISYINDAEKLINTNNVASNTPHTRHHQSPHHESISQQPRYAPPLKNPSPLSPTLHSRSTMPTLLGFPKHHKEDNQRDDSPDAVSFARHPNFTTLFSSSASASADRCSLASDSHDHDSLVSDLSQLLANDENHPKDRSTVQKNKRHTATTVEKTNGTTGTTGGRTVRLRKTSKIGEKEDRESDVRAQNPAEVSFSEALRECQERKLKSEALPVVSKFERRRLGSLDLSSAAIDSSPQFREMRSGVASQRTGACLSPGTPNYWHSSGGMPKGWSSERVPLPTNGGWRNVGVAVLPFYNGRTLPSKWEDAERWICSPVGGDGVNRSSVQLPHRRPKAKSGPLGPPGMALCSTYSPAVPTFGGRGVGNLAANSPFSAGVLAVNDLPDMGDGGNTDCGESHSVHGEACKLRSASIHGWSTDRINSQDEKPDGGDAKTASHTVSRRDVATQMSPDGSTHSSPKRRASSTSISPPLLPMVEAQTCLAKLEIRDVQVDSQVTLTRWSKKHGPLVSQRGSTNVESMREESAQIQDSAWNVGETATNSSRYKREDAKITAWENLQKAKAEASVRRLEMKLEKKRAASMDKITKKLKLAQRRAQDMRSSISARQADQVARTSSEVAYFHRRRKMGFLSGCFACRLL